MVVCSALMIWKSLMVITESDSPVVVVLRCFNRPLPSRAPKFVALGRTLLTPDLRSLTHSLTVGAWSRPSTEVTSYSYIWASHPSVPATSWSSRWPIVRSPSCIVSSRCGSCGAGPRGTVPRPHPHPHAHAHAPRQVHEKESGAVDILTKGDNNQVDDRGLYAGEPRAPTLPELA